MAADALQERAVPDEALAAFAVRLRAGFDASTRRTGHHVRRSFRIAGRRVDVEMAGAVLPERLFMALAPFEVRADSDPPDLTLRAWASQPSGVPAPEAPYDLKGRWWRGVLADTPAYAAQLQWDPHVLSFIDRTRQEATWWIRDAARLPGWETAAPFRAIVNWWAAAFDGQLTHAAAVGLDGQGVLLAGKGGSGKSTTALSCLHAGMAFAGDDYVLTTCSRGRFTVHAAYGTAKLDPERFRAWFPTWTHAACGLTEPDGKTIVRVPAEGMAGHMTVHAVQLPQVDGAGTPRLERVSARTCMLALAPSTVFQLPCSGSRAVRHLAGIARELPAYRLHLSSEPERNAALIADFVRRRRSNVL